MIVTNATTASDKEPLSVGDTLAIIAVTFLVLITLWAMWVIVHRLLTGQTILGSTVRALRGRILLQRRRRDMAASASSQAPATNFNICPPRDVEDGAGRPEAIPLPPSPVYPGHGLDLPRSPALSRVSSLDTLDGLDDLDLDNSPPSPIQPADMLRNERSVWWVQGRSQGGNLHRDGARTAS
jgi:hypothetical protein